MREIKTKFYHLLLIIGVLGSAPHIARSQITITLSKKEPTTWLRNNRFTLGEWSESANYYEDPYFGIEKVEKPLSRFDSDFDDPYRARQGSGGGNGMGSGATSFNKWIPYYERPSNCSTSTYQPETSLPKRDAAPANQQAQIVHQPRALYSKDDYIAKRAGSVRLRVQLKADGTIGSVRPLSTLPGDLTQSAVQAACYLTFYPAVAGGKPIDSVQTIVYNFHPGQVHEDEAAKYPPPPSPTSAVKIISRGRASYTPEAKQNAVQGNVVLRVTFLANGTIGSIVPLETLPDGLTEKAIEAVRQTKFEPARKNGKNITLTKTMTYSFTLY